MMRRKLLVTAFITALAPASLAAAPSPEQIINKTIDLLKKGKPTEAFEAALESSQFIKDKQSDVDSVKYQFAGLFKQVGAPLECEALVKRNLLNRYRIDQYLCMTAPQPIVIQFDFYRPKDEWQVQGFSFNTNLDDYIEESIKHEIGTKSMDKK